MATISKCFNESIDKEQLFLTRVMQFSNEGMRTYCTVETLFKSETTYRIERRETDITLAEYEQITNEFIEDNKEGQLTEIDEDTYFQMKQFILNVLSENNPLF